MLHYHLNQALARCRSTTLGCWTGIAPTTTSKTQCWPNYCTIWIQPTSMLRCPVLVQRWSTISRCWPSVAPTIVQKTRYATCTLTIITDRSVLQIGPQRWFNAGPTLLVRIMNKTMAQHWVNVYNSFHLYINMLFFSLTSRINQSCQTDAVLITANKSKRDDSRAWFWHSPPERGDNPRTTIITVQSI